MDFLVSLATAAVALLLCFCSCNRWWSHRQQRCRYAPMVGSVFHQVFHFRTVHDYLTGLSSRHRTFRLFAPFCQNIYTVDPASVEYILKTNFSNYGKGWMNYTNLKDLLGDGIFAVDGDKWRHQRKLASHEFSTKILRVFSSATFKTNIAKLACIVFENSKACNSFDIQELFLKSTMDSIFEVGFGVELNSLDGSNQKGSRFARAFDDSSVSISMRYIDVLWKIKKVLNVGLEASLKKNIKLIDEFVYEIIHSEMDNMLIRNLSSSKKGDILSRFMLESEKDPINMNHKYLRDIILNFVIAGKDTTAGTLAWFFYLLCKYPSIQEKVAQEITDATNASEHGISFMEFASTVTDETLEKMQYLHAALTETLRLYPAVPVDPKVCFSDDTLPDGFKVKKGDMVVYLPYAMGRMKYLWGNDAESFRPERWLDDDGMFRPESPFKFTAFQAGPRICLGKEFAYRQMKITAAVLLYFFRFKLRDENKAVHYRTMLTLHIDQGLYVHAFPRRIMCC